ncbi:DUF1206 domain-containing protein [Isoptericola croceus]|uniref:DUF1206 domain-containing protein n=1 Tax=Isoptericola croceus TaxID=3031406 RepID=UPI0023F6CF70|nr:DUF1206 domain-containing protein [Isoptericola croceus]
MSASGGARGAAHRAQHSSGLRALARAGYAASGVVHLLIGWLAVRLAFGSSSGSADESGAFRELASTTGGTLILWAVTVGLAALALWQLAVAVVGDPGADDAKAAGARVKAAGKGVLYGVLAGTAARYATGAGGGGGEQESLTATLLQAPAGRWLVVGVGLAIVGVGVFHVVKGWRKTFLHDLHGSGGGTVAAAVERLGQVGYVAKGVALAVLGGLFVAAGVTHDADKAGGLDDALRTIREQPFGTALLVVTGVGIAAYGVYSFARARYARL